MIHALYNYFLTRESKKVNNRIHKTLRWQLFKYLKAHLETYYKTLPLKDLNIDISSELVVSLTSIPKRIHFVPLVVKSMLNQTYKPKKIVLWLGLELFPNKEADLPKALLDLKSHGLLICFREDLKPHTKYFYAFKSYPEELIVTVDDDLFYPKDLLNRLMLTYKKYPHCVIAHRVRYIQVNKNAVLPYRNWPINPKGMRNPSHKLLATGVGGVLYKPSLFTDDLLEKTSLKKLCLNADDIWLKAHEIKDTIPVVFTHYYFRPFIEIAKSQEQGLHNKNVFNHGNDIQITDTFSYFGISNTDLD
ncbi:MAG: hypothetical protein ABJQ39_02820 [Winogradskyella arenosi]